MMKSVKLRKMNLGIGFWLSLATVMIVILGLVFTSIIPVAQAGATTQTTQDVPPVDIFGLAPINKASGLSHVPVCLPAGIGEARCHAQVIVNEHGKPLATTAPTGYGPAQFLGAYGLTGIAASTQTIAIVDAYDHPNILSDLNNYSRYYNIPELEDCSVVSSAPCFRKVDQKGGSSYPTGTSWALEIALDVEIAHAMCQNCNITLVEANSNSYADLMTAVDYAVGHATVVSNSYGSNEFRGETAYDYHFNKPGIAITFSSGDNGYGAQYPAASKYVTAVGGTTLELSNTSYVSETAWSGAGSGCSRYELKPTFQHDPGCAKRTIADVSADADPYTGAAVYDSLSGGWIQVGGTSLSSPLIAGVYALAGGVPFGTYGNSIPYAKYNYATNLHDIIGGSNGGCARRYPYLCTAVSGYDGPTGLGTPNGITAFINP